MIALIEFPYLWSSLVLLGLFASGFMLYPAQRRPMLHSALLCAPYGAASLLFVPEYWNPVRILPGPVGLEDLIFSFSSGGIVWLLATWPLGARLALHVRPARVARCYVCCALGWLLVSLACWFAGLGVMASVLIGISSVGLVLLGLRPSLWPLGVSAGIGFTLFYFAITKVAFLIWPAFLTQWNFPNLWGYHPLGVPLDEIIWSIVFSSVWSLEMAYAFDARIASTEVAAENLSRPAVQ